MMRNLGGSMGVSMAGTFLISRQKTHQEHFLEQLNTVNNLMNEYLYKMEMALRAVGKDVTAAKNLALKIVSGMAMRDSFIQSFNDVFIILATGLVISSVIVFFLKPVNSAEVFLE